MRFVTRPSADAYGFCIGVLLPQRAYPKVIGDVGDARSFTTTVLYSVYDGSPTSASDTAKALCRQGIKGLTAAWGTLEHQKAIAAAVPVPVCATSIVLTPMLATSIGPDAKLIIVSTRDEDSVRRDLERVAPSIVSKTIVGSIAESSSYRAAFDSESGTLKPNELLSDITQLIAQLLDRTRKAHAILLDGSPLTPYTALLRSTCEPPVFDLMNAISLMSAGLLPSRYTGLY